MRLSETKLFDPTTKQYANVYNVTNKKNYNPISTIKKSLTEEVLRFAYGMSFGNKGHHRKHRSGGIERRTNNQLFADTFQGKLAELAVYETLLHNGLHIEKPDFDMYGKGIWDSSDLDYKNRKISIKSTKSFGQLLLLESADWNEKGVYIPNANSANNYYDYFVLVRINPFPTDIMKKNKIYYTDNLTLEYLKEIFTNISFTYDIPGCISKKTLICLIKNDFLIKQGGYINRVLNSNRIDANNYYIQAGNLFPINRMIDQLKEI